MKADAITVEVMRNYFVCAVEQMRSVLVRSSFNPIIYELVDLSVGIYNKRMELLADAPGQTVFLGSMGPATKKIVEYMGIENIEEGDVLLSTYPYFTGSHPQDVMVIKPIFIDGEIFAWAMSKAHWMDIGAVDVYGTNTTDVFQEGLKIYGAKIWKKGVLNKDIVEIIRANSRVPDGVIGDMNAQIACSLAGENKVIDIVKRYGKDVVQEATDQFLDHGERLARQFIRDMPDGEWTADGLMDNNGITDDQVPIKVTIRVQGDQMVMDLTGSAPQQAGPTNCLYLTTCGLCRVMIKMVTTPDYPANEGCFRPIEIIAPEGSIFNPQPPAPVFLYAWPGMVMSELVFKALADVVPDSVVAMDGGDLGSILFSGINDEGNYFVGGANEGMGTGASLEADGENGLIYKIAAGSKNVPIEIIEERFPMMYEYYRLRQDSGGPGKFRGGLGIERSWLLKRPMSLVAIMEQTKVRPFGLFGGKPAKSNLGIVAEGTKREKRFGKMTGYKVDAGDTVRVYTGGGGGCGNAFERDLDHVLKDVKNGYVSAQSALEDYGVVIRETERGFEIDHFETEKARMQETKI